jgi:hypothetical protein
MKPSRATRSAAYKFAKCLLADGAEGTDVHNLISAINDNISEEVGGSILMDLLRNPEDHNADLVHHTTWFGPFGVEYFYWIAEDWAKYCNDNELRGYFRFGTKAHWDEWNKTGSHGYSKEKLDDMSAKAVEQLCVFDWHANEMEAREAKVFLNELYEKISERVDEQYKKKGKKKR